MNRGVIEHSPRQIDHHPSHKPEKGLAVTATVQRPYKQTCRKQPDKSDHELPDEQRSFVAANVAGAQERVGDLGNERSEQSGADHTNPDGDSQGARRIALGARGAFHHVVFDRTRSEREGMPSASLRLAFSVR